MVAGKDGSEKTREFASYRPASAAVPFWLPARKLWCRGPNQQNSLQWQISHSHAGVTMNSLKPDSPPPTAVPASDHGRQEVRCAVRFPLSLPVVLSTGQAEIAGLTRNVSASGVLFSLDRELPVGLDVRFSMRMPRAVLGAAQDVLVHCKGRVVRCSSSHNEHLAAATIDEYRFAEQ
jgi:hypothetical protein